MTYQAVDAEDMAVVAGVELVPRDKRKVVETVGVLAGAEDVADVVVADYHLIQNGKLVF